MQDKMMTVTGRYAAREIGTFRFVITYFTCWFAGLVWLSIKSAVTR